MKIKVVTTQNKEYYSHIGQFCLKTFDEYWDKDIIMDFYAEDFKPKIDSNRIKIIENKDVFLRWNNFKENTKLLRKKNSIFYLKSFVLLDCYKNCDADYVIWLDSDVITIDNISKDLIFNLMLDDTLITDIPCQGLLKNKEAETGFTILNLKHEFTKDFLDEYESYYHPSKFKTLEREVDGEIWFRSREHVRKKGAKINSLTSENDRGTPMSGTILKDYLVHYTKGKHKLNYANSQNKKIND